MTKTTLWILAALTVLSMSAILLKSSWLAETWFASKPGAPARLTFLVTQPNSVGPLNVSLRPEDSDRMINELVLENLVGTLTSYSVSGKLEPYLAKNWDVDPSGRVWTFELRPGLKCEDGSPIEAQAFVDNLKRQFKSYVTIGDKGSLSSFDYVAGMKEFISGKSSDIRGLSATGKYTIVFNLEKRPDNFVEDIGATYFGFWCPGNFTDGGFRKDGRFISSGTYSLVALTQDRVDLKLRRDWFRAVPHVPEEVEVSALTNSTHIGSKVRTIVQAGIEPPKFDDLGDFRVVPGSPALLTALKVSPYAPSGFFKDVNQRRLFRKLIIESDLMAKLPKDGIHRSNFFFANAPSKSDPMNAPKEFHPSDKTVKVCLTHAFSETVIGEIRSSVSNIFSATKAAKVEFEYADRSQPNWNQIISSGERYDIHFASVVVGGYFLNSQIQFMFCTNLGVSFWDASGRICKLAEEYSDGRPIGQDYVNTFNRIIEEDATVIPLFHSGMVYLYSRDIDPESITTESANYPAFDTLRLLN